MFTDIAILIIVICIAVVSYFLIHLFKRIEESLKNIENQFTDFSQKTIYIFEKTETVLTNLESITKKVRSITDNMNDDMNIVKDSLSSLSRAIEDIVNFKDKIQSKVEEPALITVSFFSGIVKGLKVFVEKLKN